MIDLQNFTAIRPSSTHLLIHLTRLSPLRNLRDVVRASAFIGSVMLHIPCYERFSPPVFKQFSRYCVISRFPPCNILPL